MRSNSENSKHLAFINRAAIGVAALGMLSGGLPVSAGQSQPSVDRIPIQQTDDRPTRERGSQTRSREDAAVPESFTVPVGTVISVRTVDWLSTDRNRVGDGFRASLDQPLIVDGWVVGRRGQSVMGQIGVVQKAGRAKGVSQLGVELTEIILVDGQQVPIRTQLQRSSAGSSRGQDAVGIGTTTGFGAAIGAVAGDGKGAGIGAAAGAAAGVIGVLATRGRATTIPPETLLTFRLEEPLTISTQRGEVAFRPANQGDYGREGLTRRPRRTTYYGPGYPYPYYCNYCGAYPYYYPGPAFVGFYGYRGHRRRW
jgi:hypothetical protein